jgi:hypothetical protein
LSRFPYYKFVLKWISKFNSKIVVVFFGSDVRSAHFDGALIGLCDGNKDEINRLAQEQIQFVTTVEKYATRIVSHPPISMFQKRRFAQYLKIGIPMYYDYTKKLVHKPHDAITTVLHAPSDSSSKGTHEIRETIKRLISSGHKILYKEIKSVSNDEIMREISNSDIVIDQLYSDIPISRIALESILCGVPVLVGSYHDFTKYNLFSGVDYPEVYMCKPHNLENVLESVIENRDGRIKKSIRARDFVIKNWNPTSIAKKYQGLLLGGCKKSMVDSLHESNDWFYLPEENKEPLYGYGIKFS